MRLCRRREKASIRSASKGQAQDVAHDDLGIAMSQMNSGQTVIPFRNGEGSTTWINGEEQRYACESATMISQFPRSDEGFPPSNTFLAVRPQARALPTIISLLKQLFAQASVYINTHRCLSRLVWRLYKGDFSVKQ
jgi:hypothetical protein